MRVLFIAAEAAPFAKAGGLGDVVGSLPGALRKLGIDARVLMPHYGMIHNEAFDITHLFSFQFHRPMGTADVNISKTVYQEVPIYFLHSWPFFSEPYHYTDNDWDVERFIFFAQAALGAVWEMANGADPEAGRWWPDLIHFHDWHTGLGPFLLYSSRFEPGWNQVASLLTIHNMGYAGKMAGLWLDTLGILPREHPTLEAIHGTGDLLPIGLAYADKLNTVSPNHAVELHYAHFSKGLEPLIWQRDEDFTGILNGIDVERYDPATSEYLFTNFDADNFRTKRIENKRGLQDLLGLPVRDEVPLLGIVTRLTEQKGIDLAIDALHQLCAEDDDLQVVVLGSGDHELEHALWSLRNTFHWKVSIHTYFDEILAQRIYAGNDLFLMPSRYEPCGMAQMIALRYGSLPVARQTGGLVDTVHNFDNADAEVGTGFTFLWETPEAIVGTIRWAMDTYRNRRAAFERMQERGMRYDWSWQASAKQYIALYQAAIDKKRAWQQSG